MTYNKLAKEMSELGFDGVILIGSLKGHCGFIRHNLSPQQLAAVLVEASDKALDCLPPIKLSKEKGAVRRARDPGHTPPSKAKGS